MLRKISFYLLLLSCMLTIRSYAKQVQSPSLTIGDFAPPLRLREWIKGEPVQGFEKGHVYVVEFWATWCGYCIEAMPHLSSLAAKYNGKVTFLGINILEKKTTSINKVKAFVDSMGAKMNYRVAIEDSSFMAEYWLQAAGESGIPATFIVDSEGRIAWIGHPSKLDTILFLASNNSWHLEDALIERDAMLNKQKAKERLAALDYEAHQQLQRFLGDPNDMYDLGSPDSALISIEKILIKNPQLKYAPWIAFHTFSALLKTDIGKANTYGTALLKAHDADGSSAITVIIDAIKWYAEKTNLITMPVGIYELGGDAYQAAIDRKQLAPKSVCKAYLKMAEWYLKANKKEKAIVAAQNALELMKKEQTQ